MSAAKTPGARPPSTSARTMAPLLQSPQPHRGHVRTPSPNYFGFNTTQEDSYDSESNRHTRKNWSPPSSAVRSTAAFSPTVIPVDQNPTFDAFRRQSESVGFNLGSLHEFDFKKPALPSAGSSNSPNTNNANNTSFFNNINISASPKATTEPRQMAMGRAPSGSISGGRAPSGSISGGRPPSGSISGVRVPSGSISGGRPPSGSISGAGNNSILDPESAYQGRSPKRHLSNDGSLTDGLRHAPERPSSQPRLNMPFNLNLPSQPQFKLRADTVPVAGPLNDSTSFITPQHLCNLLESAAEEMLILDLRVSTQYAGAHLNGALNLCIPTTLLKRPSFNVTKLAETFKDDPNQRQKFENWKSSKYIIVYDSASFQLKDATSCVNTIKKFDSEGVQGKCYILKGGFAEFAKKHPSHVQRAGSAPRRAGAPMSMKLDLAGPEIAPVIGGCPMPAEKNAANPFFGNIRQNMDLIGGVGQMEIKRPSQLSKETQEHFPPWLQEASEEKDNGARVSEKFLQIEKREQKRMQEALSGKVSYGSPTQSMPKSAIQIAGIEKGSKNRYNNIWPFEHSRVKLQDVPSSGCDYFNANYISSKRSHKRYIATQGPIPATFSDFWNVIWQQETRVIVMLTAEKEGGQVKAHNYWSDKQYGPIRLEFLSEKRASLDPAKIKRHRQQRPSVGGRKSTDGTTLARIDTTSDSTKDDQPYVIVRKLALRHEGYPFERMREITQLQYSSWPDFGAPAHPAHLLGLVEQCDAVVRSTTHSEMSEPDPPEAPPIVVHCSAGCGRTGTFCTVATVIDMLKRQRTSRDRSRRYRDSSPMHIDTRRSSVTMKDSNSDPFFTSASASASSQQQQQPSAASQTVPPSSEHDEVDGEWVNDETADLIEKTVEEFRRQRISMVQSLRQFVLCYESVMEWLVEQESQD